MFNPFPMVKTPFHSSKIFDQPALLNSLNNLLVLPRGVQLKISNETPLITKKNNKVRKT